MFIESKTEIWLREEKYDGRQNQERNLTGRKYIMVDWTKNIKKVMIYKSKEGNHSDAKERLKKKEFKNERK